MNKSALIQIKNLISASKGENTLLSVLNHLKRENKNPLLSLSSVIKHLGPGLKVSMQKRAGRIFYIPARCAERTAIYYSMAWLLKIVKTQDLRKSLTSRLLAEIYEVIKYKRGPVMKSKAELIQQLLASRIYLKTPYIKPVRKRKKQIK